MALAMPVWRRKQSARLAAVLNSPPLTWIAHSVALRKGMTPGSRRWTRAPRDRKSRAPSGRMLRPELMGRLALEHGAPRGVKTGVAKSRRSGGQRASFCYSSVSQVDRCHVVTDGRLGRESCARLQGTSHVRAKISFTPALRRARTEPSGATPAHVPKWDMARGRPVARAPLRAHQFVCEERSTRHWPEVKSW